MSPNKLFGNTWVTKNSMDRYPNSKRAQQWQRKAVIISTEHGMWRPDARGLHLQERGSVGDPYGNGPGLHPRPGA